MFFDYTFLKSMLFGEEETTNDSIPKEYHENIVNLTTKYANAIHKQTVFSAIKQSVDNCDYITTRTSTYTGTETSRHIFPISLKENECMGSIYLDIRNVSMISFDIGGQIIDRIYGEDYIYNLKKLYNMNGVFFTDDKRPVHQLPIFALKHKIPYLKRHEIQLTVEFINKYNNPNHIYYDIFENVHKDCYHKNLLFFQNQFTGNYTINQQKIGKSYQFPIPFTNDLYYLFVKANGYTGRYSLRLNGDSFLLRESDEVNGYHIFPLTEKILTQDGEINTENLPYGINCSDIENIKLILDDISENNCPIEVSINCISSRIMRISGGMVGIGMNNQ